MEISPQIRPMLQVATTQALAVMPPIVSRWTPAISPASRPPIGPPRKPASIGPMSRTEMTAPLRSNPEMFP